MASLAWLVGLVIVGAVFAATLGVLRRYFRRVAVYEWETVLLYRGGRFRRIADPGIHYLFGPGDDAIRFDTRAQNLIISGQEVLSRDAIGLKLSLVVQYRVRDARRVVQTMPVRDVAQLGLHLHPLAQLPIRQAVASRNLDELLADRESIPQSIRSELEPKFVDSGLDLVAVAIRDIMIAKEVRDAYAASALAQKQAQALIETARGETAALRSLANAARMMRDNPELMQLRVLQAMQSGDGRKHTFVVDMANSAAARRTREASAGSPDSEGSS
jgi:regulator of protease activity HflC (stomatin/prohibitin superfamily)